MEEVKSEYQEFADKVEKLLKEDRSWEATYAGYARDLTSNQEQREQRLAARKRFHVPAPFYCYTTIGEEKSGGSPVFNLRYLGQSIANITVKGDDVTLSTTDKQVEHNKKYFGLDDSLKKVNWDGAEARVFREKFKGMTPDKLPRQKEHMWESALFTELEKTASLDKTLLGIQPIRFSRGTRIHMKTALAASEAKKGECTVSKSGGDIDIFCRRKEGAGARLTVIELKDENKAGESFHKAIYQAIAYAVFIHALARSKCGDNWMELWGMDKKNLQKNITINAVAAMPSGDEDDLTFSDKGKNIIELKTDETGFHDKIELHYMAIDPDENPQTKGIKFKSSLKPAVKS